MARMACPSCGAVMTWPGLEGGLARCSKCGATEDVAPVSTRHPLAKVERRARAVREAQARLDAAMRGAVDRGQSTRDIAAAAGLAHSTVARMVAGRASRAKAGGWTQPTLDGELVE
jgi:DNA-directed RNA polymerase subunit M/transcription elongation factor TFIIS